MLCGAAYTRLSHKNSAKKDVSWQMGCISSGELYGDIRILRTSGSEPALTEQAVAEVVPSPFELSKISRSIKVLLRACGVS